MNKLYCKIIRIVKQIQPSLRIVRFYRPQWRSYRISLYCQIIIIFQHIGIIQIAVGRDSDSLSCINIADRSVPTDRNRLLCAMFQKLKFYFRITYRIDKYANTVLGESHHRISFVIFPRKSSTAFILYNGLGSTQIITGFRILHSHKNQTDIYDISISILSYIIVTHACTSSFIVCPYTDTLCITFTLSIIRKSFPVQIVTAKRFICCNSGLKLHIKAVSIIYLLILIPGLNRHGCCLRSMNRQKTQNCLQNKKQCHQQGPKAFFPF